MRGLPGMLFANMFSGAVIGKQVHLFEDKDLAPRGTMQNMHVHAAAYIERCIRWSLCMEHIHKQHSQSCKSPKAAL